MKLMVRPAVVGDAREIARIRIITWRDAYKGIMPQEILDAFDLEKESQRWQEGLENFPPERGAFIAELAEEDGRRVTAGYCFCGPERSQDPEYPAELYAIYVLPEYHRLGAGRALVREAAKFLAGHGYERMIIYVLKENAPSRKFYEALGGVAVREKPDDIRGVQMIEVGYGYELGSLVG